MPENYTEIKVQYLAILRCRTWHKWPSTIKFSSPYGFKDPILIDNQPLYLSIEIITYKERQTPENEPPKEIKFGSLIWKTAMNSGSWLGNYYLKSSEDSSLVTFNYSLPYEGEIDITLSIGLKHKILPTSLKPIAQTICNEIVAYLNMCLDDFIIPVAPVSIQKFARNGNKKMETSIEVLVKERETIDVEKIPLLMSNYVNHRESLDQKKIEARGVAIRRYISSLDETDNIDRYCDLWECCEFLTLFEQAKGGKPSKIATALAKHFDKNNFSIPKTTIENTLDIKGIYKTRGKIVHEAVDNPSDFENKLKLLNAITEELIKYTFELSFEKKNKLSDYFNGYKI